MCGLFGRVLEARFTCRYLVLQPPRIRSLQWIIYFLYCSGVLAHFLYHFAICHRRMDAHTGAAPKTVTAEAVHQGKSKWFRVAGSPKTIGLADFSGQIFAS